MKNLILFFFISISAVVVKAQQLIPLPIDKDVRYGRLDNGLTYIIRHNENPKNRADFYIAQKVGSILEEEDQRGLAHFLEHMAFNGSEHFPAKSMLNYLEKNGVKFGTDLNAYTSFDQTVYNIKNVPIGHTGIVDSCLYILYDWSAAISLEDAEIDNERGVINEEWRTRNDSYTRMFEKTLPIMMKGSKYAERMPIGKMEVVMNFPYQTIKDYYKKWYRPDLQGIIIVGDINTDSIENKLHELFDNRKLSKNVATRTSFPVPDNTEPLIAIATDKEAESTIVALFCKHKVMPEAVKATILGLSDLYKKRIISSVLNSRLRELAQKPNSPILMAQSYDDNMIANTIGAFMVQAMAKEGKSAEALKLITTEVERLSRYGITESEYERSKSEIISDFEKQYNERNKRENGSYIQEYVDFFLNGGSIMGIEREYNAIRNMTTEFNVNTINNYIKNLIGDDNRIVMIQGIEKDGVTYPTEEEVKNILKNVNSEQIERYTDNISVKHIIKDEPISGKIANSKIDKNLGITTWTLSNGAKVILKPTDFKDDEIILTGISKGGSLQYKDKDIYNTRNFNNVIENSRWGGFTLIERQKLLSGKQAGIMLELNSKNEAIKGESSVKDFKTMIQLLYLSMTDITRDEDAFMAWSNRTKDMLRNISASPESAINDTLTFALYNGNPRIMRQKETNIDNVNYNRIIEIWKERFGNAADFTFTITGNINEDSIRPIVEKYIASLPSNKKRESAGRDKIGLRLKNYNNNFERTMQNVAGTVYVVYTGKCKYSTENEIKMTMFKQIMDIVFTATIREEEGGTYGVGTYAKIMREEGEWMYMLMFDTNVEKMKKLEDRAISELQKVITNGPSEGSFNKVKEYMLKKNADNMRKNDYWINELNDIPLYGKSEILHYRKMIEEQTPETIKAFINKLFKGASMIEVTMKGIEQK
ncbi:MAG: insulinase family protein [Bacteroidales bacterium]